MAIIIEDGLATSSEGADSFIIYDLVTTGAIHWVYSATGSDSNSGSEAEPLATIGQAITNATANNGDIIVIKSGHAETISSSKTINKAGVKIFGIGSGTSAPQFTCAAAIDMFNVTADNVWISNLYFPVGTTATNTARINVDASGVNIRSCTFMCGQYDAAGITLTSNALNFRGQSISMTVSADGPDYGIIAESASIRNLILDTCTFNGGTYGWDLGAVYANVSHLNFNYYYITQTGNNAGVVHTSSSAAKGTIARFISASANGVSV